MRQMRKMVVAVSSPDFDTSLGPAMGLALKATQTAVHEVMASVHQEFGIAVVPPMGIMDQLESGVNVDIDNVEFKWVSCPKNFSMGACWEKSMNP